MLAAVKDNIEVLRIFIYKLNFFNINTEMTEEPIFSKLKDIYIINNPGSSSNHALSA